MEARYEYDMNILSFIDEFDAESAVSNFSSTTEYFDKLDEFVNDWHSYLHDYNPTVVIYGDDVRREFSLDMERIRGIATLLELKDVNSELDSLEEALGKSDPKSLSDGLIKFFAVLEITAGQIVLGRCGERQPIIIAVDDMPEMLAAVQNALESSYKVIGLTSGADAINAANLYTPSMFLLDIEMPEMSGLELAEKLRENDKFKSTPILFLTSLATREHVLEAKRLGANDYCLKPFNRDTLLQKIKANL